MNRTYHIWTIGCQMNEADTRHLAAQLEDLGYKPEATAHLADVIVLNTCVIRQQAEDKALDQLRQLKGLKRSNPDLTVAVMGCIVGRKLEESLRAQFPYVDVFMGPSETAPLLEYLGAGPGGPAHTVHSDISCGRGLLTPRSQNALPPSARGRTVNAYVPVVLGCSHTCTYCVIPSRRGGERSRPKADVLQEVQKLADEGVKDVTLLGQIVDRYGVDFNDGTDLSDLLADVSLVSGIARVRFLTSHPNWFTDKLLETMASVEKICPCIEIPVQAGNNEVLANMRRGYTVDIYRRIVDIIRGRIPDVAINTDVIVGFPGETETQFMDTHRLMEDLQFDMAHIARYSERPGTPAARNLKDDVPEDEKERRRVALEQLLHDTLEKKHLSLVGRKLDVLIEERAGKKWKGRTPQNKVVLIEDDRDLRGQLVQAVITRTGAFSQFGAVR
jgi:tRNA-2-methylthio-N6-dimethylallyladenosine synthase